VLVLQLARLGDLIQSVPAIVGLAAQDRRRVIDVLCPAPLAPVATWIPNISAVIPWDGRHWQALAQRAALDEARVALADLVPQPYDVVCNLNNNPRAILLAHLVGHQVVGPGAAGPLNQAHPPWVAYLRQVAKARGANRVHLADAWCGCCGVKPVGLAPRLALPAMDLPQDLTQFTQVPGLRVALVVGAGDPNRIIPPFIWAQWITTLVRTSVEGAVVLVGTAREREAAWRIQDRLPPVVASRVWDATGRTTLAQLAQVLAQCHWVVGADTGPLHLGAAVGARAMGFYLASARVHETGPYGSGHWVWQAELARPACSWPVEESVALIVTGSWSSVPAGWSLWRSALDACGVYFLEAGASGEPDQSRADVWRQLG
jgi:ADP-heptose:LPS heptosyltransferase